MNLYVTASINSFTTTTKPGKKQDIVILEDVIDQIEAKQFVNVLKVATGYNSTGYVYISKISLQDFQDFEATLIKMRSDFDDYQAFQVYDELRKVFKEFLTYFSWAYEPLSENGDEDLYLGFDVNPLFRTKLADAHIYRNRLEYATELYDIFDVNYKKLSSYYEKNDISSN
ncbi:hypothetical protein NQ095_05160 [Rossellomorea sp. SC111]|uniref:hypothetical protein n=1 Tax=Rossellomorea sp. SC111 TaxID=2968985 RepID=UPI00215B01C0|nr:hypothetical protein [Rossellomorea sp. SC111]MCR8847786.1 hypothetical protein [Rossellomorea sp. SC111]